MAQQLQERQHKQRERARQAREDLHALNSQLAAVKDQIAGPLNVPRRRERGDGRSLTAVAQAMDEELTNSPAYTELKTPTSWGLSDDEPLLRPRARVPRCISPSKATLARAHEMRVQRSPRRGGSPRRSGSPQRTLSLPNETERRLRPSESARVSSASSQAVMTAASPLLHEMLQAASPSISRLGSPGRYSQSRAGGSPRSGSPGRTRGTLDSPLASVRALSASRTNAHTFVQQLRTRSPRRGDYRSPVRSPARKALHLGSDDEDGDGAGARLSPTMKRTSSTGVSTPVVCWPRSCI
jgi:hypothetical protein